MPYLLLGPMTLAIGARTPQHLPIVFKVVVVSILMFSATSVPLIRGGIIIILVVIVVVLVFIILVVEVLIVLILIQFLIELVVLT